MKLLLCFLTFLASIFVSAIMFWAGIVQNQIELYIILTLIIMWSGAKLTAKIIAKIN